MIPRIAPLDPTVVNRIAAGEVIHRPSHALKELLENCLDAGASLITITLKDGGLSLLEIADNGHGIHPHDLPIVCLRFTTSKLRSFDDLRTVATFGFRGEALASLSHVARVAIVSRTAESDCAYSAEYIDGKPLNDAITPCAHPTIGTTISIQDLFYNLPARRRAMRSYNEEHANVVDTLVRYAVHYPSVAMTLRKHGAGVPDVSTKGGSTTDRIDVIKAVYGPAIARSLVPLAADLGADMGSLSALVSSPANSSFKSMTLLLFINNRLVESAAIKRTIKALYARYLPKGSHPWVYLSLTLPAHTVDVNVHPTKKEVHFLHHDYIVGMVAEKFAAVVGEEETSRVFEVQVLTQPTPSSSSVAKRKAVDQDEPQDEDSSGPRKRSNTSASNAASTTRRESTLVRTDARATTLDQYFQPSQSSSLSLSRLGAADTDDAGADDFTPLHGGPRNLNLTSIADLHAELASLTHVPPDQSPLTHHTYVGHVTGGLVAIQSGTDLYLADMPVLADDLMYRLALDGFANYPALRVDPPMSVAECIQVAVQVEVKRGGVPNHVDPEKIVQSIAAQLLTRADLLLDYFSVTLTPDGLLTTLPRLLPKYIPPLDLLPSFLLRLGTEVNWTEEKPCLAGILDELARFYAPKGIGEDVSEVGCVSETVVKNVLMPAMRNLPMTSECLSGAFVRCANLKEMYRVFERC
ncbi:hypothetical protein BCR44DRAFT_37160 [Catenaria anguillulae PL171]|uniref:DNA mismatch repair protein S5 domain-containing protein n=1 Tax=Catenaria anguillulae PL171 TaxID=765915 RepID=A0A1Y2HJY2_9FUNG|nr:hypothetical protein BCR44DRAFT_37160 [Catenaria anguillulae PL171]